MRSPEPFFAADPRWAWVLGTGRCGSTLVQRVLARHPEVGFVSKIEDRFPALVWTGRFHPGLYRLVPDRLITKDRSRYGPSEGYRVLEREVSAALARPARDLTAADADPWLASRLRTAFDSRAAGQGKPVFLHKFTGWPRSGLLDAVFPGSRFVHVLRDGRAVVASLLQMDWWQGHKGPESWPWGPIPDAYREEYEASGRNFAVLAGCAWKILLDAFDAARAEIPEERWLEIRYEDVVAAPRERFAEMLDFLGLPFDSRFERALAGYEFRAGPVTAYRRDLSPATLALLESCLASHLERHGYAVSPATFMGQV